MSQERGFRFEYALHNERCKFGIHGVVWVRNEKEKQAEWTDSISELGFFEIDLLSIC